MTASPIPPRSQAEHTLRVVRAAVLGLLALGLLGTGVELVLLGHTEDPWQWTPIVLIAVGLAVVGWRWARPGRASGRALQATMLLFLAAGLLGIVLHFRGNVEFELEMTPALRGLPLVREALTGATPALSPGAMVLLGLLGLLHTIADPRDGRQSDPPSTHG